MHHEQLLVNNAYIEKKKVRDWLNAHFFLNNMRILHSKHSSYWTLAFFSFNNIRIVCLKGEIFVHMTQIESVRFRFYIEIFWACINTDYFNLKVLNFFSLQKKRKERMSINLNAYNIQQKEVDHHCDRWQPLLPICEHSLR